MLLGAVEPAVVLAAPPVGTVAGVAKDALERPVAGAQLRLESSDGQVAVALRGVPREKWERCQPLHAWSPPCREEIEGFRRERRAARCDRADFYDDDGISRREREVRGGR